MTWVCPNCRRRFKNTNQWHSCARLDVEHHLRNKSPAVRATLEKLLRELGKLGEITIEAVKTSIEVKAGATFVSIRTRRDYLEIGFQLTGEKKELPVYKTARISGNRVLHFAILEGPEDIDRRLLAWLDESYRLAAG